MRSEYKIFGIVTAFLFAACGVYWWWSWYDSDPHRTEFVGVVADVNLDRELRPGHAVPELVGQTGRELAAQPEPFGPLDSLL